MNYYYITSYEQINTFLYLKEQDSNVKWKLIVDSDDIESLCIQLKWNYDRIYLENIDLKFTNFFNFFYLYKQKKLINKQIDVISRKYVNEEIFFTVRCVGISSLYLISNLAVNNKATYIENSIKNNQIEESFGYFNLYLKKFIYNIIFKLNLKIHALNGEKWICACETFFQLKNINKILIENDISKLIYKYKLPKKKDEDKKIFFIMGHSIRVDSSVFNKQDIICLYKFIINNEKNIVLKPHPNSEKYINNEKPIKYFGNKLDDKLNEKISLQDIYLPIELMKDEISMCISLGSSALASISSFNIPSICLIDLLSKSTKWDAEKYRENLNKKSNGKIIFVKSYNELQNLISNPCR